MMSIRKGVGRYLAKILSDTIIAIRIAKKDDAIRMRTDGREVSPIDRCSGTMERSSGSGVSNREL